MTDLERMIKNQEQSAYWADYGRKNLFRYLDGRRAKIPESDLAMIREAAILGQELSRLYANGIL